MMTMSPKICLVSKCIKQRNALLVNSNVIRRKTEMANIQPF